MAKNIPGPLQAFLNSTTEFIMADLLTVTLFSGAVYRWTTFDFPLVSGGHTFEVPPNAPTLTRSRTRWVEGLELDTLTLTLGVGDGGYTIGGIHLPAAADNGLFDGAQVLVERTFMPTPGDTSLGVVVLFSGSVAGVVPSSTAVALTLKSDLEILARQMPRNLYMPGCAHVLFDAGCTLDRASFTVTDAVGVGATVLSIPSGLAAVDDYFTLGVITFTSGVCAGVSRGVRGFTSAGGVVTLAVSLPAAPAAGDTFEIAPGCDRTQATCLAKFANLDHFRGFPYVPKPETAR